MKLKTMCFVVSCLFICATASATFVDVSTTPSVIAPNTTTYRIYAHFDVGDQLLAVYGSPSVQALEFNTSTALVNNGGPFTGQKLEDFAQFPISGAEDSWVTIEADTFSPNDTDYSPGFAGSDGITNIIKGSSFGDSDGGWFDSDPNTPAVDTGAGILIAQFTIADEGGGAPGTWGLSGTVAYQPLNEGFLEAPFSIFVPEPTTLSLLGLGGLTLSAVLRRRRES